MNASTLCHLVTLGGSAARVTLEVETWVPSSKRRDRGQHRGARGCGRVWRGVWATWSCRRGRGQGELERWLRPCDVCRGRGVLLKIPGCP